MNPPDINSIACPEAEQLEDALAHLKQAAFALSIAAARERSREYRRLQKQWQRARLAPKESAPPVERRSA